MSDSTQFIDPLTRLLDSFANLSIDSILQYQHKSLDNVIYNSVAQLFEVSYYAQTLVDWMRRGIPYCLRLAQSDHKEDLYQLNEALDQLRSKTTVNKQTDSTMIILRDTWVQDYGRSTHDHDDPDDDTVKQWTIRLTDQMIYNHTSNKKNANPLIQLLNKVYLYFILLLPLMHRFKSDRIERQVMCHIPTMFGQQDKYNNDTIDGETIEFLQQIWIPILHGQHRSGLQQDDLITVYLTENEAERLTGQLNNLHTSLDKITIYWKQWINCFLSADKLEDATAKGNHTVYCSCIVS